ncbi:hypothetical protein [uncultured Gimesia sp.]|uniref:hypothetical protein n=1 Tax=uncultured Gimesia sp. TaxID=1678688 RepID=UPI002632A0A1|nr:hypothetical protein [uncultured Gimesia sp.]
MVEKQDNIGLLAMFYKIVGVIMFLFSLFPCIHLIIGIAIMAGGFKSEDVAPPFIFGLVFTIIPLIFISCGVALAISMFMCSRYLEAKSNYRFCQIVSGISCIFMPFGTVLGVLTLIELSKDPIRESFVS